MFAVCLILLAVYALLFLTLLRSLRAHSNRKSL